MQIKVNGEDHEITGNTSLGLLVSQLSLPKERIAIELNGEIVRRNRWDETIVADGDKIEIVHFVGGGNSRKSEPGVVATGSTARLR